MADPSKGEVKGKGTQNAKNNPSDERASARSQKAWGTCACNHGPNKKGKGKEGPRSPLRQVGSRLNFQKSASSRRNYRFHKVSFSSSCRRIISLLYSPPCLQRVLPRVGDNVIRFTTRESLECCASAAAQTPSFVLICP